VWYKKKHKINPKKKKKKKKKLYSAALYLSNQFKPFPQPLIFQQEKGKEGGIWRTWSPLASWPQ
jgi:hypothetical protein